MANRNKIILTLILIGGIIFNLNSLCNGDIYPLESFDLFSICYYFSIFSPVVMLCMSIYIIWSKIWFNFKCCYALVWINIITSILLFFEHIFFMLGLVVALDSNMRGFDPITLVIICIINILLLDSTYKRNLYSKCSNCNANIKKGDFFCNNCGIKL